MPKSKAGYSQGERIIFSRGAAEVVMGRFQFEIENDYALVFFREAAGGCGFSYIPTADIIGSVDRPKPESFQSLCVSGCNPAA